VTRNAKHLYASVLNGVEGSQLIDGLMMNYFQCDNIIGGDKSVAGLLDSLTKAFVRNGLVRRQQMFQLEQYLAVSAVEQLPAVYAFTRFFKRDWMKVNFTSEISSYIYEMKTAQNIFIEMRNNLPPSSAAFRTNFSYRTDLDLVYSIIQPHIDSNFLTPEEHKIMVDSIFIMIENGISFAPSTNNSFITNSKGNSRRVTYEPAFEKYLIYADELPKVLITDIALRHMQNNYQYMTHVYEARISSFVAHPHPGTEHPRHARQRCRPRSLETLRR